MSVGRGLGVFLVAGVDEGRRRVSFTFVSPSHNIYTHMHVHERKRGEKREEEKDRGGDAHR